MTDAQHETERRFVVAGNENEFRRWCGWNGVGRRDPRVRFVWGWEVLQGQCDYTLLTEGTFEQRADWPKIQEVHEQNKLRDQGRTK